MPAARRKSVPRTFWFQIVDWERIETCAEVCDLSAAEFLLAAVSAAIEDGSATAGSPERIAPLIKRTIRYCYMVATKMRDDMLAVGRDEDMDALIREGRAL